MEMPVCLSELRKGIAARDAEQIRTALSGLHPADAAAALALLDLDEIASYIVTAGASGSVETFQFLPFEIQEEVLTRLPKETLGRLVGLMSPDDREDLVERLDAGFRDLILSLLIHREREDVLHLLEYPDDSAGAYMTTDYASLPEGITVAQAIDQLRIQAPKKETIYYVYVLDAQRHLVGFVSLQDIILASRASRVNEIMRSDVISVNVREDIETVGKNLARYDFLAVPVVDDENRLVGIITYDDVLDVIQEEATEDMYRLANLDTNETIASPIWRAIRLRLPWLLLNLGTSLVAASAVSFFSETIEQVVALASLMTMVATLGGNSGNQALTIVVRSLALEGDKLHGTWRVVLKNLVVGLTNGLVCGMAVAVLSYLWFHNAWISVLACIAMTLNMALSGLYGTLVPLTLRRFKLDPALGSSVLVTTACDSGGFMILLGMATLFMRYLAGH
ncbi:MAG: magnesium transporter [Desulfomonilaceae bacterium]|nr:magnesium transporter [Desulfomonilaceae bacterium]